MFVTKKTLPRRTFLRGLGATSWVTWPICRPILLVMASATIPALPLFGFPENTPMANLLLTVLDKVGAPTEKLGDSRGLLRPDYLSV